jgi:phospholipid/cholesterol/gamma-HCH transport system substrate-binding protein
MFSAKLQYKTTFEDVAGLQRGSPVRMGGVDVGVVANVGHSNDPNDPRLYVTLEIVADEARRIRLDSSATIEGKGLLGDKLVSLSPGTVGKPRIEPGGVIPSDQSQDLTRAIAQVGTMAAKAERILSNLEESTSALADDELHREIKASVASLDGILGSINRGEGYLGKLIKDQAEAERLSRTVDTLDHAAQELTTTVEGINRVIAQVNEGPGFAHDVLYGQGPTEAIASFGNAAEEVAVTLKGIREGNGLMRGVVYGDEGSTRLAENLEVISTDVRGIVADIRAGKGTLGALLVDPSVYEDVKLLLGNVSRNRALRALVRYSVEQDEESKPVEITAPNPKPPQPSPKK